VSELFSEMQSYATEAENILGALQGMEPGEGNTLIPGHDSPVTVLYGTSRVFLVPIAGGGYRKRIETPATMTRTQGLPPPAQNSKLVRTDQTPHITYIVTDVDTTDPLDYIFTLVVQG
jgi:hypothetical protein